MPSATRLTIIVQSMNFHSFVTLHISPFRLNICRYRDLTLSVIFTGEMGLRIIGEVQIHDQEIHQLKSKVRVCRRSRFVHPKVTWKDVSSQFIGIWKLHDTIDFCAYSVSSGIRFLLLASKHATLFDISMLMFRLFNAYACFCCRRCTTSIKWRGPRVSKP